MDSTHGGFNFNEADDLDEEGEEVRKVRPFRRDITKKKRYPTSFLRNLQLLQLLLIWMLKPRIPRKTISTSSMTPHKRVHNNIIKKNVLPRILRRKQELISKAPNTPPHNRENTFQETFKTKSQSQPTKPGDPLLIRTTRKAGNIPPAAYKPINVTSREYSTSREYEFERRLTALAIHKTHEAQCTTVDFVNIARKAQFSNELEEGKCNHSLFKVDRDLWKVCSDYGSVVDVFIPNKRSKSGKRFAFVRFIKVINFDRLIENLNTIWMGRFHLSANSARFDRPTGPSVNKDKPIHPGKHANHGAPSYLSAAKGNPIVQPNISSSPALVLDDALVVHRNLDNFVMGEVKHFASISNICTLISAEGFNNVKPTYLGGL
ncbi:RNA-directed DNA polymerase, eukaryota, nucleotide-binding alpha-beta plait domain protein [Tanacetum coccineum]